MDIGHSATWTPADVAVHYMLPLSCHSDAPEMELHLMTRISMHAVIPGIAHSCHCKNSIAYPLISTNLVRVTSSE